MKERKLQNAWSSHKFQSSGLDRASPSWMKMNEDLDQFDTNKCDDEWIAGSANNGIKGCGNVHRTTGNTQFVYVLHMVS